MNTGTSHNRAALRRRRVLLALGDSLAVGVASWLLLGQVALELVSDRQLDLLSQSAASAAEQSSRTRAALHALSIELDLPSQEPGCNAKLQHTLQWVQLSIPGARGALQVDDGVVVCSSTRALQSGTRLPGPGSLHPDGVHAWHGVTLPGMEQLGPHVVLERHRLALLLHPSEQFTQFFQAGTPVAVYSPRPPHLPALLAPQIPVSMLTPLPDGVDLQRVRDPASGDLVVRRRTPSNQGIVLATLPAAQLQVLADEQFRQLRGLSPLAALLALAFLLWRLRPGYRTARQELLHALRNEQLYLLYQPVIDLETGRCIGAEALMRWRQNDGSVLSPNSFVPLAEQCGLSHRLTARACQVIAEELPPLLAAFPDFRIGLNVAAQELHSHQIVTRLATLRRKLALAPSQLVVELTESSLVDAEHALPVINQLRANGIAVAIDDFGTGYCSLSYLATYPFDILKIDRVFINAAGTDSVIGPIAEHIVTLSKTLGVQCLAEGVETPEQAERFGQCGATYAQGFHFGAPMPLAQILRLMRIEAGQ